LKASASLLAELGLALADLVLAPPRLAGQFLSRRRRRQEFQSLGFDPPPEPVSSSPPAGRLRRVLLSCGDASGETHALRLVQSLQRRHPGLVVAGFGGRRLEQAGMQVWQPLADLNVMGFADVVGELPLFLRCVRRFARELALRPPDAVVLVDYPGLNRHLLRMASRAGIPVVDFIAPQLWAWAPWRVRDFRRADRLLTILPFEGDWFRARGAHPLYLGHPLGDTLADPPAEAPPPRMDEDAWWVGILPGSRRREVDQNLPVVLQAAARLQQRHPRVRFILPHLREDLWPRLEYHLGRSRVDIVRARGCFHGVLPRLRAAWVASGTALLETAAHGVPPVLVYQLPSRFSAWVGHALLGVPFIGSLNLLAGREVAPEHFGPALDPAALAESLAGRLDGPLREAALRDLHELKPHFGRPGTAERAVRALETVVQEKGRQGEDGAEKEGMDSPPGRSSPACP